MSNSCWLECVKWINDCGCLPLYLRILYEKNQLKLNDFAYELKGGEILCHLLNHLAPNSIDLSRLVENPLSSEQFCLNNLNLFLDGCKSKHFNLDESKLFKVDDYYELTFDSIMHTLSMLSKCKASKVKGYRGFSINDKEMDATFSNKDLFYDKRHNTKSQLFNNLSILPDSNYHAINQSFLNKENNEIKSLFGNKQNQRGGGGGGGEQATNALRKAKSINETDLVLEEILNTENSFISTLHSLIYEHLNPLSTKLKDEDAGCIRINCDVLLKLHISLFQKLVDACKDVSGRVSRVCEVFCSFEEKILKNYTIYCININNAMKRVDTLSNEKQTNPTIIQEIALCRQKSKNPNFSLNDLLVHPFQRITKYHLLIKELYSKFNSFTDTDDAIRRKIKQTHQTMEDICNYLNECEKDQEEKSKIDILIKSMKGIKSNQQQIDLKEFGRFLKDETVKRIISTNLQENTKKNIFLFEKALILTKKLLGSFTHVDTLTIDDYEIADKNHSENSIRIVNAVNKKFYQIFFYSPQQTEQWIELFNSIRNEFSSCNKHRFLLINFDLNLVKCKVCFKYLKGIFFQGYRCEYCFQVAHKECLINVDKCDTVSFKPERNKLTPTFTLTRSLSNNIPNELPNFKRAATLATRSHHHQAAAAASPPTKPNRSRFFKSINKFKGDSLFDFEPLLLFDKDEYIYVMDTSDDYEGFNENKNYIIGFKLRFKCSKTHIDYYKEEGYFPRNLVDFFDLSFELEFYSWYLKCEKSLASLILSRIGNICGQTLFMIRYQADSGYTISIKYKNRNYHAKINSIKLNPKLMEIFEFGKYFKRKILKNLKSDDEPAINGKVFYTIGADIYFISIVDLVSYYSINKLEPISLDTTLGVPYREVMPKPIYTAKATIDFSPGQTETTSIYLELLQSNFYFVLKEFNNGRCTVFNTDGLIGYADKNHLALVI